MEEILKKIQDKYATQGENPESYLKGLYHAKPITYWDYVQVETLLSLQRPRTHYKDEFIFIVYHQITELVLRLMVHELEQLVEENEASESDMEMRVERLNRYTGLLINSFGIMSEGMDYDDYNEFRMTLTPASGFQSAQFRKIELMCTDMDNLINERARLKMPSGLSVRQKFDYVYWQDAGKNHTTGKKTMTLSLFEGKYLNEFVALAEAMQTSNLNQRIMAMNPQGSLREALRQFDKRYNIEWPLVHLNTARSYLLQKGERKAATGGSEWEKYLHPAWQRRKFFPGLWNAEELENWAKEYM